MRTNRLLNRVDRSHMADVVRLADSNNGRIPAQIPDHYVRWCAAQLASARPSKTIAPNVVTL